VTDAGKLHLRVFVEGLEVPAISARITGAEGSPLLAEVALVPTDPVFDLKPRSSVFVCVYDNDLIGHSYSEDLLTQTLAHLSGADLRNYKVGFFGEILATTFQKQPGARSALISCMSSESYWDSVKQGYINFANGGVETIELAFFGVKASQAQSFDVAGKDLQSNIYTWLAKSKSKVTGKASIYLGAHRVLREMWFSVNDWYAKAFNRWRIGDCVVGLPEDETAAKLFKMDYFKKWLTNQIGGQGGMYTLGQVMQMLLGNVFHTTVTVPFARFDPKGTVRGYDRNDGSKYLKRLIKRSTWKDATLNSTIIKPDTAFLVPPVCNIIFPHQYSTMSYQRAYTQEPTRLFFRSSLMFTGHSEWLTERFYAPDFASILKMKQSSGGAFRERMASVVLPHERFVGLNPVEGWSDDISAYVAKGPRKEYLAALADYTFWKMRFESRTLNGTGPLNLNLLPGYPALVMSDSMSTEHLAKHVQGNMHTVAHLIDQNGGFTQFTMTHVRHHTEVVDLDSGGSVVDKEGDGANYKSLEQITSRGSDGFMDNRYDVERIGQEVYQPIFGCDSLYDALAGVAAQLEISDALSASLKLPLVAGGTKVWADIDSKKHPTRKAIWGLEILYRHAVETGADLQDFSRQVCWRPKASLPEIMGIPSGAEDAEVEGSAVGIAALAGSNIPAEGFLSSAVDPASYACTAGDTYTGSTRTYSTEFHSVDAHPPGTDTQTLHVHGGVADGGVLPADLEALRLDSEVSGDRIDVSDTMSFQGGVVVYDEAYTDQSEVPPQVQIPHRVSHDKEAPASYGLADDGIERQRAVSIYLDSLRLRGLRG
jgi:hypothetical protein